MGDINSADLGDFLSIEESQILERSSGDSGLIEKRAEPLTFSVNYTWRLRCLLFQSGTG